MLYKSFADYIKLHELSSDHVEDLEDVENLAFDDIFGKAYRVVIPFQDGELAKIKAEIEDFAPDDKKIAVDLDQGTVDEEGVTAQGKPYKRVHRLAAYIQKNYPRLFNKYNQAASGFGKGEEKVSKEYSIILSRHPIDIVRMSDHQGITSCHSQGEQYFQCALQEAEHGPVAYLVKTSDLNQVKAEVPTDEEIFADPQRRVTGIRPIARLRVRRFINEKKNYDLAVPELRVYGKNINGFEQSVSDWLYGKQKSKIGDTLPRMKDFIRTGGSYADHMSSKLFNAFFKQNDHYTGDATYKGLGKYNIFDQFQQEISEIDKEYNKFKNPINAEAQIDDDYADSPYISMYCSVSFIFDKSMILKWPKKEEDILHQINNDCNHLSAENITFLNNKENLELVVDIGIEGYRNDSPDGYRDLLRHAKELDNNYQEEYAIVYNILVKENILKVPYTQQHLDNLHNHKFKNFEIQHDEDTGGIVVHVPEFRIATLNNPTLATFTVRNYETIVTQIKRMIISALANKVRTFSMMARRQKMFPGVDRINPIQNANIEPKINIETHGGSFFLEILWEIPLSMNDVEAVNTIKLLTMLDHDFDMFLANIVKSFRQLIGVNNLKETIEFKEFLYA